MTAGRDLSPDDPRPRRSRRDGEVPMGPRYRISPAIGRTCEEDLFLFTREQARRLDSACEERFGIPAMLLMENAAIGIADVVCSRLVGLDDPRVLVCCGPGNNGGDGLAVARHLHNRGVGVCVVLVFRIGDDRWGGGLAGVQFAMVGAMGVSVFVCREGRWIGSVASMESAVEGCRLGFVDGVEEGAARLVLGGKRVVPDVVVDAILGTGASRPLDGVMSDAVVAINRLGGQGSCVVAVDVPTGLDADTGGCLGGPQGSMPVVIADLTVALAGLKPGLVAFDAQGVVGDVVVRPIGAPVCLLESIGERVESLSARVDGDDGDEASGEDLTNRLLDGGFEDDDDGGDADGGRGAGGGGGGGGTGGGGGGDGGGGIGDGGGGGGLGGGDRPSRGR